jgi:lipid A 3-O-deacylase
MGGRASAAAPGRSCCRSRGCLRLRILGMVFPILLVGARLAAQGQQGLLSTNYMLESAQWLEPPRQSIWEKGVGEGFRRSAESLSLSAGGVYGLAAFGGIEVHDLALISLSYSHMLGPVLGEGHWYRGNPEFRLELFTGAQFSPSSEWFVGLTPHLRYSFATGTRWIPFMDIGAGLTATGIGPPDLSGTFEFNLQATTGIHWFFKDNTALTLDAGYVHWSCAGIHKPNLGLNGIMGKLGVSFFF